MISYMIYGHGRSFQKWNVRNVLYQLKNCYCSISFLKPSTNREEKSLRHVAVVAKFLDDNTPKKSLIKWIRTVSNFMDFIQFHVICQILAKFLGLNPKGRYLSLQKGKENFYVVFTCSIKRARGIRKFMSQPCFDD